MSLALSGADAGRLVVAAGLTYASASSGPCAGRRPATGCSR